MFYLTRQFNWSWIPISFMVFLISCQEHVVRSAQNDPPASLATRHLAIVGGQNESGWEGVGALTMRAPGYGYVGSFCTGSLIDPEWVLTAAHCLTDTDPQGIQPTPYNVSFYVGTNANPVGFGGRPGGSFYQADRFVIHPDYTPSTFDDDIALVHLSEPAFGIETYAYNTFNLNSYSGSNALYVGYGVSDGNARTGGGIKRSTSLPIRQVYTREYYSQFNGSGTCFGDSGGPGLLNIQGTVRIVGVNSSVSGETPCQGFYTSMRVDAYAPWISGVIGAVLPDCNQQGGSCLCDAACSPDGSCDNSACQVMSCGDTYQCLIDCGEDAGCQSVCYAEATEEGRTALDQLFYCFNEECEGQQGQAFSECVEQSCSAETETCFPRVTGTASCEDVSTCLSGCSSNDETCQVSCFESGTEEAQDQFLAINECLGEECGSINDSQAYYQCIQDRCADRYRACYPPDDCRLTGGDCPSGTACYPGIVGSVCFPSQDVQLDQPCTPLDGELICADGLICIRGTCSAFCLSEADCDNGVSCEQPIFRGEEVGICSCIDQDGDGVCAADDCDDSNDRLGISEPERCGDGVDNNCDGSVDEGCETCEDSDGDGYCLGELDCDDRDASTHTNAAERCGDGVDNNCNGVIDEDCDGCIDADGDGFCGNIDDCADDQFGVNPNASEICGDGLDNNCDGVIDVNCIGPEQDGPTFVFEDDNEEMRADIVVVSGGSKRTAASCTTRQSGSHPFLLVLMISCWFISRHRRTSVLTRLP